MLKRAQNDTFPVSAFASGGSPAEGPSADRRNRSDDSLGVGARKANQQRGKTSVSRGIRNFRPIVRVRTE